MTTNARAKVQEPANITRIPLPRQPRLGRFPKAGTPAGVRRQRFRILDFLNSSGTRSYRVQGMTRTGNYIRQNFASLIDAEARRLELEQEYILGAPAEVPRRTALSESQLRIAEAGFDLLHKSEAEDLDLLHALKDWLRRGRQKTTESPRLDDAVQQFTDWLASDACDFRETTKVNLRSRAMMFANGVGNHRLDAITSDMLHEYLGGRKVKPSSRDNDRRALSRFFSWCIEPPRRWISTNPARCETRSRRSAIDTEAPPAVLTLDQCKRLLHAAQTYRDGILLPYTVATLLCGIRPAEAQRLTWRQVNLDDCEIRLEAHQTKTGRPRVIAFNDGPREQAPFNAAVKAWLHVCRGVPFCPPTLRKRLRSLRQQAGIKGWIVDVCRHTAISHFFRLTGSYGRTAEVFGNSESIIKAHYQGRVNSEDTRRFYALRPQSKGGRE